MQKLAKWISKFCKIEVSRKVPGFWLPPGLEWSLADPSQAESSQAESSTAEPQLIVLLVHKCGAEHTDRLPGGQEQHTCVARDAGG